MELLKDLSVATGLTLLFLLLSWNYGRVLSGGRSLNTIKRKILLYALMFVLGTQYTMALVADLALAEGFGAPAHRSLGCNSGTHGVVA
jgi:hypothetical protein